MGSVYLGNITKVFGINMASVSMALVESDPWSIVEDNVDRFGRAKSQPLVTKQDPLALAWVGYNMWEKNPTTVNRWAAFNELTAHEHDFIIANETRRYYRNKLTIRTLKGDTLTKFQQDLHAVTMGNSLTQQHVGLLYRLPYFYVEDIARDKLVEMFKDVPSVVQEPPQRQTKQLTPVTKIFKSRAKQEVVELWWATETGQAACLPVGYTNPLRSLIEGLFDQGQPVALQAVYFTKNQSRTNFTNWLISGEIKLA
jgi:hypothetical protein